MTQNWNVQDNIEMGITFFYEGLAQDAYECFTTALHLEPNNGAALTFRAKASLQLYDKRRDTGLEDIEAALRVDPCKGELYLIENQILITQPGQYQEALKRLQKAQFKVLHDDPDIDRIRQLFQKQKRTQLNYIMALPTEVLYQIMSLISFRSRVPCLAVSHRWRDTLSRISDLWRYLDYSEGIIGINHYRPFQQRRHYPRTAYDHDYQIILDPHLESCIATSLGRFMEWSDIRKVKIPLTMETLDKLLQKRPALSEVSFMDGPMFVDSLVLQLIIREIGSSWRKVEFYSNIEPLSFFHAASLYCPLLTDLTIHQCQPQRDMSDSLVQLFCPIPSVTTLRLHHCIFFRVLPILSRIFPELRELTIEGNDLTMNLDLYTMLRNATKLKRLILQDRFPTIGNHLLSFLRDAIKEHGQQPLEWLDINDFSLKREGMLSLADIMESGTLKCYNETFVMDKQIDREKLKKTIDKKHPTIQQVMDRRRQQSQQQQQQGQQLAQQVLQQIRQQVQQHQQQGGRQVSFYDLTLDDDEQQAEEEEEEDEEEQEEYDEEDDDSDRDYYQYLDDISYELLYDDLNDPLDFFN